MREAGVVGRLRPPWNAPKREQFRRKKMSAKIIALLILLIWSFF